MRERGTELGRTCNLFLRAVPRNNLRGGSSIAVYNTLGILARCTPSTYTRHLEWSTFQRQAEAQFTISSPEEMSSEAETNCSPTPSRLIYFIFFPPALPTIRLPTFFPLVGTTPDTQPRKPIRPFFYWPSARRT